VVRKKYRAPLLGILSLFEIKVAIRSPPQMIGVVDNLYPIVGMPGDQGEQMRIQMFGCSPAEVGH
jgi:hypothetical protein